MSIAAIPGSYDPVTLGHADIVRRAARLYDRVYVVAMDNVDKTYLLTPQERLLLLEDALRGVPGVIVEYAQGYFYEYARRRGVRAIIKGIRSAQDLKYEIEIADFNRRHYPEAETLFMPAEADLSGISSRTVKDKVLRGESVGHMVTPLCLHMLQSKLL